MCSARTPTAYCRAAGWIPAVGGSMGVLTIIDERVAAASALVFTAFSPNDYVELPYDDFARLERPRIASFAVGGELSESGETKDIQKDA